MVGALQAEIVADYWNLNWKVVRRFARVPALLSQVVDGLATSRDQDEDNAFLSKMVGSRENEMSPEVFLNSYNR
jgi:hypothetical protein